MIERSPYGLPLYILLSQQYSLLEYHDLAVGSAYKALLLSDALQDESDEFHELAVADCSNLIVEVASEAEKHIYYSKHDEDDREEDSARLQWVVTKYYCKPMSA